MLSLRFVSGAAAVVGLAAILLAVTVAGAAQQTFPDPANDVVYVDDSNVVIGAAPAGHEADITSVSASLNGTFESCVVRPNIGGGAAATQLDLFEEYSLFLQFFLYLFGAEDSNLAAAQTPEPAIIGIWQWHDGVLTSYVRDGNNQAIAGASVVSEDEGRTVCLHVPASYAPQFNTLGVVSFAKPNESDAYRGRDQAGLFDLTQLEPTPTATATQVPPTATATQPLPTATATQPAATATATQVAATATTAPATATPGAPKTGSGTGTGSDSQPILLAVGILALLVAAGTAGVEFSRRR